MRVKALQLGYYGERRVRPGDIFTLSRPGDFSYHWMQLVDTKDEAEDNAAYDAIDADRAILDKAAKAAKENGKTYSRPVRPKRSSEESVPGTRIPTTRQSKSSKQKPIEPEQATTGDQSVI